MNPALFTVYIAQKCNGAQIGAQMVPKFFYIKLKVNYFLPKPIKIKEKMQPK
jgi:hypothetical protein